MHCQSGDSSRPFSGGVGPELGGFRLGARYRSLSPPGRIQPLGRAPFTFVLAFLPFFLSAAATYARVQTSPAVTISSLAITSNPGPDETYAAGDTIQVTITFDETVTVTGRPQLTLRVGKQPRRANYQGNLGAALLFSYSVMEGDQNDNGISIEPDSLLLHGGTIQDGGNDEALLHHDALVADSRHKVDGVEPALRSAAVDGVELRLTYDEVLDGSSTPVTGDFTVEVEDSVRSVSAVSVGGPAVTLTLAASVVHGEAVTVSYALPAEGPANLIRDLAGNPAAAVANQTVRNRTGAKRGPTGGGLPRKTQRQIEALLAEKARRTPAQRKVSSQLLDAWQTVRGQPAENELVMVDIRADVTAAVLERIRALGGTVINSVARFRAIRARLPLATVETLAELDAVRSIRTADKAVTHQPPPR